ncbi:hypothetical protein MGYG_08839 [Nannizzia gypsea CBS 118893]|uniref:Uncharacterized protein n=1 Tax=Arthroderma gypseum (strain ATCC MYA-4604 / CBS 118893) TaxID=535722 RepID=E4V748_ARTGP|nr:hypothetical protein MGYG_08839 [Nannizzia gypsea CBS 118893]EFQ96914.1 hypothetical protein MGYG_08839 [Nannizzia gypsea CBS 118893]
MTKKTRQTLSSHHQEEASSICKGRAASVAVCGAVCLAVNRPPPAAEEKEPDGFRDRSFSSLSPSACISEDFQCHGNAVVVHTAGDDDQAAAEADEVELEVEAGAAKSEKNPRCRCGCGDVLEGEGIGIGERLAAPCMMHRRDHTSLFTVLPFCSAEASLTNSDS